MKNAFFFFGILLLSSPALASGFRCELPAGEFALSGSAFYDLVRNDETNSYSVLDTTGKNLGELQARTEDGFTYWHSSSMNIVFFLNQDDSPSLSAGQIYECKEN